MRRRKAVQPRAAERLVPLLRNDSRFRSQDELLRMLDDLLAVCLASHWALRIEMAKTTRRLAQELSARRPLLPIAPWPWTIAYWPLATVLPSALYHLPELPSCASVRAMMSSRCGCGTVAPGIEHEALWTLCVSSSPDTLRIQLPHQSGRLGSRARITIPAGKQIPGAQARDRVARAVALGPRNLACVRTIVYGVNTPFETSWPACQLALISCEERNGMGVGMAERAG